MRQGTTTHTLFTAIAIMLAVQFFPGVSRADPSSPREVIMDTSTRFLDTLQSQRSRISEDPAAAYRIATDIVMPHVDFEQISQWVMGKYWRQTSATQREQFTQEFRTLLMHTYVTAMVQYADQILNLGKNISFPPVPPSQEENRTSVRMDIQLDNGKKIPVLYDMHRLKQDWLIVDVTIDGISLATTYRGTISSQIRKEGVDGLIATLQTKNRAHPGNAVIKASSHP